jgi:hypothetical protein
MFAIAHDKYMINQGVTRVVSMVRQLAAALGPIDGLRRSGVESGSKPPQSKEYAFLS